MYSSILALLNRSLRMDVRSRGVHLVRLALVVAIYLVVIQIQQIGVLRGAPGLDFFRTILWLNLIFLTLIGIGGFSCTITEEKEEDALGLLRMAGVSPLGLLLGKTGGRLTQCLALLMVQYPFTLLSITLGGVGRLQIQAAYLSLAAYLVMLAGVGALFSTRAATSRGAARLMTIVLAIYVVVPLLCQEWADRLARSGSTSLLRPVMAAVSRSSLFLTTGDILTTGFGDPLLSIQVVSNSLIGVASFLLAWVLFESCTRAPHTEPVTRAFVTTSARQFRWFNAGRPWTNPLVWKDFQFAAGGVAGLLIRTACYLALFAACVFESDHLTDGYRLFLGFQLAALPFDASLLVSRCLQDEVRGQTIAALVMLPRSVPAIVYSKLRGAMIGLMPGLVCFVFALIGSGLIPEMLSEPSWRYSYSLALIPGSMLLLPHLTAVVALVARWGATPIAIAALYAVKVVESMLFLPLMAAGGVFTMELYQLFAVTLNVGLCVACHFEVIRRFRKLAEK